MKSRNRALILVFTLAVVFIMGALGLLWYYTEHMDRSGWVQQNGYYYYLDEKGEPVSGWLEDDGSLYYFGLNSAMVTGWQDIGGSRYYFGGNGVMRTGWQEVDGQRRYFRQDGTVAQGWEYVDGENRYFLSGGILATGWQQLEGVRCFLSDEGTLATGWLEQSEGRYYLDETGSPVRGLTTLEGSTYYFYESSGLMAQGLVEMENGRYFFGEDGVMQTGWQQIGEDTFYFEEDGTLATGWLEDGEYRYYLTYDDGALTGAQILDDKAYYFTPDGIYVLLVNADNPLPKSYVPELVDLDGRHEVASVCLEPLKNMLTDCLKAGGEYSINNTYRSYAEQKDILQTRYERYLEADPELSDNDAWQKALAEVARPGTSEHQTGLCMDINGAGVESVPWLLEHCWEYGFILRFPEGKKDITGIVYEPWHFRYVGTRVSIPMRDSGLCLEEYLGAA